MKNAHENREELDPSTWGDAPPGTEFSWEALLQFRLAAVQQFMDFKKAGHDGSSIDDALDRTTDIEQRCSEIATKMSADSIEAVTMKLAHWVLDHDFLNPQAVIEHPSDALALSCFGDLLNLAGQTGVLARLRVSG